MSHLKKGALKRDQALKPRRKAEGWIMEKLFFLFKIAVLLKEKKKFFHTTKDASKTLPAFLTLLISPSFLIYILLFFFREREKKIGTQLFFLYSQKKGKKKKKSFLNAYPNSGVEIGHGDLLGSLDSSGNLLLMLLR